MTDKPFTLGDMKIRIDELMKEYDENTNMIVSTEPMFWWHIYGIGTLTASYKEAPDKTILVVECLPGVIK